jgi:hypothetical protein
MPCILHAWCCSLIASLARTWPTPHQLRLIPRLGQLLLLLLVLLRLVTWFHHLLLLLLVRLVPWLDQLLLLIGGGVC